MNRATVANAKHLVAVSEMYQDTKYIYYVINDLM